jgi:hypothetical protein
MLTATPCEEIPIFRAERQIYGFLIDYSRSASHVREEPEPRPFLCGEAGTNRAAIERRQLQGDSFKWTLQTGVSDLDREYSYAEVVKTFTTEAERLKLRLAGMAADRHYKMFYTGVFVPNDSGGEQNTISYMSTYRIFPVYARVDE